MVRLPPELLGEVFRHLKIVAKSRLDLVSASLVCTAWFSEARPLVSPDALKSLSLPNCRHGRHQVERLWRLSSLLTESLRHGLDYCDLVREIRVTLPFMEDQAQSGADAIRSIVSLSPPNLRQVTVNVLNSGRFHPQLTELIDHMCAGHTPTTLNIRSALSLHSHEVLQEVSLRILEHFEPFVREIHLRGVQLDDRIHLVLTRCRLVERLAVERYPARLHPAVPDALPRLADALPELTSLTFRLGDRVSSGSLRHLIVRCPRLRELRIRCDGSVDDECLKFVAREARTLVELELEDCTGVMGKGEEWVEEDVAWHGLRWLRIAGTSEVAPSFVERVLAVCGELEYLRVPEYEVLEDKMLEFGFEKGKDLAWHRTVW